MTSMCKDSMVDSCKDSNAIKGKDAQEQKPTSRSNKPLQQKSGATRLIRKEVKNRAVLPYTNLALVMSEAIAHGGNLPTRLFPNRAQKCRHVCRGRLTV
jgi:hypothetical protein